MSVLSTYASGYRREYQNDEAELRALLGENARARGGGLATIDPENPQLYWWPSSLDFKEEAARHGSAIPIANFQALITEIRKGKNLEKVLWFGHGASSELQFGEGVRFAQSNVTTLGNADVSKHFASGGSITFYACDAAQSQPFLQAISNALRVKVCGFASGVKWGTKFVGVPPNRRITKRGLDAGSLPTNTVCATPR